MAKKRRTSAKTKTRTVYRTAPRRRSSRRKSTYNASVKRKLATTGTAIALSKYLIPLGMQAVQSKSVAPITNAFTNKDTLMAMGKDAVVGYAIGYGAGMVADITGLKKPINKIAKKVKL